MMMNGDLQSNEKIDGQPANITNNDRPQTPIANQNPLQNLMSQGKPQTQQNNNEGEFNTLMDGEQSQLERPNTTEMVNPMGGLNAIGNNIKEALAKNFQKKINQRRVLKSVQEETKQSINDLRNEFSIHLAKIYQNHTREEAVKTCFRIIQRNCDSQEALRVFLSVLGDRSSQIANSDRKPQALMFHVQMYGFIAKCFKTDLIDPLDNPPSLIKTIKKIQDSVFSFLQENYKMVWKGCGMCLVDLIDSCFPDRTQPLQGNQSVASFIFDPLLKFHKGGYSIVTQQGASYCIQYLVQHFIDQKTYSDLLEEIHQPILQTTTKYKVDNESQLIAIKLLIEALGIRVASDHVEGLIAICTKVIGLQASSLLLKKAACELLTILGEHLKPIAEHVVPSYSSSVMKALDTLSSEKHLELCDARNKAKAAWHELQTIYDDMDPQKKANVLSTLMQKNLQNKFNKLRDQVKQTREQQRRAQSANSRVMHDAIAEEINQSFKIVSQNFLRKGKGQGGGLARGAAGFSPNASKDKKLYEDLKRISELNSFMRVGHSVGKTGSLSPKREEAMKQDFLQDLSQNPFIDDSQQIQQQEPKYVYSPKVKQMMKDMGFGQQNNNLLNDLITNNDMGVPLTKDMRQMNYPQQQDPQMIGTPVFSGDQLSFMPNQGQNINGQFVGNVPNQPGQMYQNQLSPVQDQNYQHQYNPQPNENQSQQHQPQPVNNVHQQQPFYQQEPLSQPQTTMAQLISNSQPNPYLLQHINQQPDQSTNNQQSQIQRNPTFGQQTPQNTQQPQIQHQQLIQQQDQQTVDFATASPNTQQRILDDQRQQLKLKQQQMLQSNPQLVKYQQQKQFLEDKFNQAQQERINKQQTAVQQQNNNDVGYHIQSDPGSIDACTDEDQSLQVQQQQVNGSQAINTGPNIPQQQQMSNGNGYVKDQNNHQVEPQFMDSLEPVKNQPLLSNQIGQNQFIPSHQKQQPQQPPSKQQTSNPLQPQKSTPPQHYQQNKQQQNQLSQNKSLTQIKEEGESEIDKESSLNDRDLMSTPGTAQKQQKMGIYSQQKEEDQNDIKDEENAKQLEVQKRKMIVAPQKNEIGQANSNLMIQGQINRPQSAFQYKIDPLVNQQLTRGQTQVGPQLNSQNSQSQLQKLPPLQQQQQLLNNLPQQDHIHYNNQMQRQQQHKAYQQQPIQNQPTLITQSQLQSQAPCQNLHQQRPQYLPPIQQQPQYQQQHIQTQPNTLTQQAMPHQQQYLNQQQQQPIQNMKQNHQPLISGGNTQPITNYQSQPIPPHYHPQQQMQYQQPPIQTQSQTQQINQGQNQQNPQQNQAASLIARQIMMMQKQMEQGFTKMCEKIEDIENRVDNASHQLNQYERQQVENQKHQEQKDYENQQQFRRLQDTINSQQRYMQDQYARSTPQAFYDDQPYPHLNQQANPQREPRFRQQTDTSYYPPPQNHLPSPVPQTYQAAQPAQIIHKSPSRTQKQSKISLVWSRVLDLVKKKQYEDAYRLTLKEADDIYLLRLVAQTGPVVKQLDDNTAFSVINRLNKIVRSGVFEAMEIEWIEDAHRRGLFQQLNKHQQNEYLDTLFHFSQSRLLPKISGRAQEVYAQIKMNSTLQNKKE